MAHSLKRLRQRFPVYSRMLRLYPKQYRREYEGEMLQVASDMVSDTRSTRETWYVRLRLALDLPKSVTEEHIQNIGDKMNPWVTVGVFLGLSPWLYFLFEQFIIWFGNYFMYSRAVPGPHIKLALAIGGVIATLFILSKVKTRIARAAVAVGLFASLLFLTLIFIQCRNFCAPYFGF